MIVLTFLFLTTSSWAEPAWPKLQQGEFANKLVRQLNIQGQLPLAYNTQDCIDLLVSYGIAPLKGWNRNASLTKDDYTSILGMATGEEGVIAKVAQDTCDQIVHLINENFGQVALDKWQTLLQGCPYGEAYKIDRSTLTKQVKKHYHPDQNWSRAMFFESAKEEFTF